MPRPNLRTAGRSTSFSESETKCPEGGISEAFREDSPLSYYDRFTIVFQSFYSFEKAILSAKSLLYLQPFIPEVHV